MFSEWTETDRQTATFNWEMPTVQETKPRTTHQKACRLFVGLEQVTMPKLCKLYDGDGDDDDDNDDDDISTYSTLVVFFFWGVPPHNFSDKSPLLTLKIFRNVIGNM